LSLKQTAAPHARQKRHEIVRNVGSVLCYQLHEHVFQLVERASLRKQRYVQLGQAIYEQAPLWQFLDSQICIHRV